MLILSEVGRGRNISLTGLLRNLSRREGIPLSTLKLNARILRELGLIRIVEEEGMRIVRLTPLGHFMLGLLKDDVKDIRVDGELITFLKEKAKAIRKHVLRMILEAEMGHLGASLSIVEILVSLYFAKMRYDIRDPWWPFRDRLLLSKGHAAPALYATLAEAGFIKKEVLMTFRDVKSPLQGHPDMGIPGVDMVSGSLGQCLSIACGMALALKRDRIPAKVYVILGDGELDEGQVWEAAMTASKYELDNLIAIVDRNEFQQEGRTEEIKPLEPLSLKWLAFGWYVFEVNGHDFRELLWALNEADKVRQRPCVIIAHTIKGRGFPPAEGNNEYHSKPIDGRTLKAWGFAL